MKLLQLVKELDEEFRINMHPEDLVEWAVTQDNKKYIHPPFIEHQTALMLKAAEEITKVHSVVFLTDQVIDEICKEKNGLIITHHHFDYYEDERGLKPINPETIEKLINCGHSIYTAHAPLDTHPVYGTSITLAEFHGISIESRFYDFFGEPTGIIGSIEPTLFEEFAGKVKETLGRDSIDLTKHREKVQKIAVIAGGGDLPEILQQAYNNGCDTFYTGTIVHRWAQENIQRWNRELKILNQKLKLNLIGGTHYGTEKPAMIKLEKFFKKQGIPMTFHEDYELLAQG